MKMIIKKYKEVSLEYDAEVYCLIDNIYKKLMEEDKPRNYLLKGKSI
jgi:hypothetical protein